MAGIVFSMAECYNIRDHRNMEGSRMKSIRDVYKIGKGPSSSHTMGPERAARLFLSKYPDAETYRVVLYGSLSKTGRGHGTDRALVAGLLGMQPDDDRIPHSFSIAKEAGLHFKIGTTNLRGAHPNTAVLRLTGASGRKLEVVGASIGGGRINICQIDGITTNFGGDHNTLIVHNQDTPGHVAAVTTCLSQHGVNIATMQLYRSTAGGYAVMVLECDEPIPDEIAGQLGSQPGIVKVTILNL
jgi:L-serine dehydratase